MKRLLAIAWKELMHLRRDRISIAMIAVLPTVQFLLFGFAIDTDVRHVPLAVLDRDPSPASRDLVRRLEATTYYHAIGAVGGYDEAGRALREGRVGAVLVVPPDFAAAQAAGTPVTVQLLVDASDPLTVGSTTGAASGLAQAMSRQAPPGVSVEVDLRYNPEQISGVYIVPGLVGVILTFTLVLMTALAIARERERGTIEALLVSPVRSWELMAGKLLPYIAIGYLQMSLVLTLGGALFGIWPGPRLLELYLVAALFIAANLSIGLVFSTFAQTQGQAMQLAVFFLLPNVLLSGFMFPVAAMPAVARWISECLPLTHFLRVVRGMVLKGASTGELGGEILALALALALTMTAAVLRFRKRLG